MTETAFKSKVEKLLNNYDAWYIKYWAGSKFTKEGIPDILSCINGKFYGIELKKDTGKPTLLQLKKLKDIRDAKGIGILLYPKDLNSFIEFINETKSGKDWYRENISMQQTWFEKLNI